MQIFFDLSRKLQNTSTTVYYTLAHIIVKFDVGATKKVTATLTREEAVGTAAAMLSRTAAPEFVHVPVLRCVATAAAAMDAAASIRAESAEACQQGAREWAVQFAEASQRAQQRGIGAAEEARAAAFHDVVCGSRDACETLFGVEDAFAVGLAVLRDARRFALGKARDRQAAEMDACAVVAAAASSSAGDLSALVARHVAELDALERSWNSKEAALEVQQTADYWSAVTELLSSAPSLATEESIESPSVPLPSPSPPRATSTSTRSLTQKLFGGGGGGGRRAAQHSAAITNVSVTPPRTPPLQTPSEKRTPQQRVSLPLLIGQGQLKMLYKVDSIKASLLPDAVTNVCVCGSGNAVADVARSPRRLQMLRRLYSREIAALLLPTAAGGKEESRWDAEFRRQCGTSCDFHFGSLDKQLSACGDLGQLQPGDVYITRHSNLLDVHAVFHLVTDPEDNVLSGTKTASSTIQGLWSVLALCSDFDVGELVLPIPLAATLPEAAPSPSTTTSPAPQNSADFEDILLRNAEVVLRNIRAFLTATASESIKRFVFVFPPEAPDTVLEHLNSLF